MKIEVASVAMNGVTRPRSQQAVADAEAEADERAEDQRRPHADTGGVKVGGDDPREPEIAPTERSKPPPMKTSVPPQAMIPTGAVWNARFFMFAGVRKTSLGSERVTNRATKATTMP